MTSLEKKDTFKRVCLKILFFIPLFLLFSCKPFVGTVTLSGTFFSTSIKKFDCTGYYCDPYFSRVNLSSPDYRSPSKVIDLSTTVNVSFYRFSGNYLYQRIKASTFAGPMIGPIEVEGNDIHLELETYDIAKSWNTILTLPNGISLDLFPHDNYLEITEIPFNKGFIYWIIPSNSNPIIGIALELDNFSNVAEELSNDPFFHRILQSTSTEKRI